MIKEILKTIIEIINFVLWLIGLVVFIIICWVLRDFDFDGMSNSMSDVLDHLVMRPDIGGHGGQRWCQEMTRDIVEDVTVHVSSKIWAPKPSPAALRRKINAKGGLRINVRCFQSTHGCVAKFICF